MVGLIPMEKSSLPLIILGGGFTGKVIYRQALKSQRPLFITSRSPELHLQSFPENARIRFDLEKPESWINLPEKGEAIWSLPIIPLEQIERFIEKKGAIFHRIVVIGSTSAYQVDPEKGVVIVDECSPIHLTDPRVKGEGLLQKGLNAIILRSAGIYGPGRNPLDWIQKGHLKNGPRYLNLIHVEDLAALSLLALEKGMPGEVYNVSDGNPRKISDLVETASIRWKIPIPPLSTEADPGKKVSNQKIVHLLNYSLQFPDLFQALDRLQKEIPAD
jgi:hypothetical protein